MVLAVLLAPLLLVADAARVGSASRGSKNSILNSTALWCSSGVGTENHLIGLVPIPRSEDEDGGTLHTMTVRRVTSIARNDQTVPFATDRCSCRPWPPLLRPLRGLRLPTQSQRRTDGECVRMLA